MSQQKSPEIVKIIEEKTSFEEGVVDHKIPHSKGGKTTVENGQWSCIHCNLKKLNKVD